MKRFIVILFALWTASISFAQDNLAVFSTSQFETHQRLFLAPLDGWLFHSGNNPEWANPGIDLRGWEKLKPTELSAEMEDETGRIEGWFRLKIKLDDSFEGIPLAISRNLWAATDVYIDGKLMQAFGNTGNPYNAFNPILKYPIPVPLVTGKEYLLAIHFVDYETTFTQREIRLKPANLKSLINLTGPQYISRVTNEFKQTHIYGALCIGISFILFFLYWLLVYLNPNEKIFWLIASLTSLVLLVAVGLFYNTFYEISYPAEKWRFLLTVTFQPVITIFSLIILEWLLLKKTTWITIALLVAVPVTSTTAHLFSISPPFGISFTAMLVYFGYLLYSNWSAIKGAQWAVVAALVVPLVGVTLYVNLHKYSLDLYNEYEKLMISISILMTPLPLLVYISVRFKEVLAAIREESKKVLRVTEEKREILAQQKVVLEQQVRDRTAELNTSLENLKATQSQLIQSEKMASLGELTAGIAHEIQNPLNFVNNFSEVSNEILDEMIEEIENGDLEEVKAIATDIKQNLDKILHHGKRADSIVKGMLQHSRSSTGEKEQTDINALADEYLRLAYHGLRAKDKSFNATLETDFDPSVGKVDVIPQDLGRVLLNLITNAFHAVKEKSLQSESVDYKPTISVTTKKEESKISISVKDNGKGIPDHIKDKIFQPFFTTKATGEGTGLGLSLSYDIVKAHGGTLTCSSKVDEGTEFIIKLPLN
jgi:signal transduction histidine kinase